MRISDWSSDVCSSDLKVIRRVEFWMHFRKDFRKQPVPAHHEKDAGLSEHHHQDNGWQRQARGKSDEIPDLGPADLPQCPGERFLRTADCRLLNGCTGM